MHNGSIVVNKLTHIPLVASIQTWTHTHIHVSSRTTFAFLLPRHLIEIVVVAVFFFILN